MKQEISPILRRIIIAGTAVIFVVLYVMALIKQGGEIFLVLTLLMLLLPGLGYLSLFWPRTLFRLQHWTTISNIDDVELSSWYLATSRIGGILLLVIAAAIPLAMAILE